MSTRSAKRDALKSASALVGPDASPNTAPTVATPAPASDAQPLPPTDTKPGIGDNIAKPSKRALDNARAGIERAMSGEATTETGRGMIAAAIVDYCLNSLKWKPIDAIMRGQKDARVKGNELSEFRASCVNLFVGARPSSGNRNDSLSVKHAAQVAIALYERHQFHVNQAANLALCLIADGCTMRDYDASNDTWSLRGALYCEDGCTPVDGKARYAMQRVHAKADMIPCKAGDAETQMPRDRAHYINVSSQRHAILAWSAVMVDRRAAHHNATPPQAKAQNKQPQANGYNAGAVTNGPQSQQTPAPSPAPLPPVATDAPITPAVNGNATTNTPQPTNAPRDASVIDNFVATMLSVRRATLAVCEAPDMAHLQPAALMRIGPSTIKGDGWQAWLDTVKICVAWHALHTADANKPDAQPAKVTREAPPATVVDGVVLSTPVKADKIDAAATDATSDAPIAAVDNAEATAAKPTRAAKSKSSKRAA